MSVDISINSWNTDYQKYGTLLSLTAIWTALQDKTLIGTSQNCNSISLQSLTVHSHRQRSIQWNYSWKCNTAKSCTEYSRETKIRLHHWAQIDFVIKVREFTKIATFVDSKQNKNKIIFGTICDEVLWPSGYLWCPK